MATTTNYGWETPDDTDLVKDGALAQRTTASAIDSSLFSITGGKNVGLVHLNTTSFTSQSTISINNVFNSTYDNYKIELNLNSVSASQTVQMRLRVSGADNSTANYFSSGISTIPTSGTISTWLYQAATVWNPIRLTGASASEITVFNPAKAIPTFINYNSNGNFGDTQFNIGGGQHFVSSAFDGFSLISSTGNMSGTVRIYGLRNS